MSEQKQDGKPVENKPAKNGPIYFNKNITAHIPNKETSNGLEKKHFKRGEEIPEALHKEMISGKHASKEKPAELVEGPINTRKSVKLPADVTDSMAPRASGKE